MTVSAKARTAVGHPGSPDFVITIYFAIHNTTVPFFFLAHDGSGNDWWYCIRSCCPSLYHWASSAQDFMCIFMIDFSSDKNIVISFEYGFKLFFIYCTSEKPPNFRILLSARGRCGNLQNMTDSFVLNLSVPVTYSVCHFPCLNSQETVMSLLRNSVAILSQDLHHRVVGVSVEKVQAWWSNLSLNRHYCIDLPSLKPMQVTQIMVVRQ